MAMRHSHQRDAIVSFLMTRKDHPTAECVYQHVRQDNPNISLGTVYRNLTQLAEMGEILRLRLGDGVDHFDYDTSLHHHFLCRSCGQVLDLEVEEPIVNLNRIINFEGAVEGCSICFHGECPTCKQQKQV